MDQEDAYRYTNYIKQIHGSKLKILPPAISPINDIPSPNSSQALAASFMESANNSYAGIEGFLEQKKELSADNVNLILGELSYRGCIKTYNLKMLYEDLMQINNWRMERPFPDCYSRDRIWSDLNRSELQIREQIRRELKDAARDAAFPQKDLRESLIDFKSQAQKNQLLQSGLETELESTASTQTGGTYSRRLIY